MPYFFKLSVGIGSNTLTKNLPLFKMWPNGLTGLLVFEIKIGTMGILSC